MGDAWLARHDVTGPTPVQDRLVKEDLCSPQPEAGQKIAAWPQDSPRHRPHSSLGNRTAQEFTAKARQQNKVA
ncbi:hypothetical protein DXV76_11180 [Rhodobacteraceae bacterium CCMM004]|nr:hypothetical protein DXV76_11180 [Rhodobacteraceae bacterium CCMM004]